MKKEMRKRNTLGPVRIGAVKIVGTDAMGMAETNTVSTVEIGAENMAETVVTCAVGKVVVSISVSTASHGSSKVSAIRGINMQNKGRPHQRVTQICMYKEKKGGRGGGRNLTR